MRLTIHYFGLIADITGKKKESVSFENGNPSVAAIRLELEGSYPELQNTTYSIAVNQTIVATDFLISDTDEIALLPPFAGG